MKKYRKKPVEIEAVQFTNDNFRDITDWIERNGGEIAGAQSNPDLDIGIVFKIRTLEGDMNVVNGDHVIKGVQGEFYPCKPDIFEETYEEIENDSTTD